MLAGDSGNDSLRGGAGNDDISGGSGDDYLSGDDGDDAISGDEGNDFLYGGFGRDSLAGGAGNDTMYGAGDADTLDGSDGNDALYGDSDDDILSGGAGDDYLAGGQGNDVYAFQAGFGHDVIDNVYDPNTSAFDVIRFDETIAPASVRGTRNNEDLLLSVAATGDQIRVRNYFHNFARGNYIVNEVQFADGTVWDIPTIKQLVLQATSGNDELHGYEGGDVTSGLAGNDTIYGDLGDDMLSGGADDDTIYGGVGNDVIDGGSGDDFLIGNTIPSGPYGSALGKGVLDNDTYLFGRGDGDDTIQDFDSRAGNLDTLRLKDGVAPEDLVAHKNGLDLILAISDTGDRITLQNFFYESYQVPEDNPSQIEKIEFENGIIWTLSTMKEVLHVGSRGGDSIAGQGGDDLIEGRGGNDLLAGGAGADIIRGGAGDDILDGGTGDDYLDGNADDSGVSPGPMTLNASDNDTYLFGWGDGQDTLRDYDWRTGNEDTIRFKDGVQASDVQFEHVTDSSDLKVILGERLDSITIKNWFGYADYFKIERFAFEDGTVLDSAYVNSHLSKLGTVGDYLLQGSYSSETFCGQAGHDTLVGGGGNDVFDGGPGDDLLKGSYDNDTYLFGRGAGHDTIIDSGCSDTDVLALQAGLGPDHIVVRKAGDDMVLTIVDADDSLVVKNGFSDYSSFNRIEQVRFADGQSWIFATLQARSLQATEGDDIIEGSSAADVLDGRGGDDILRGGYGNDIYIFGRGYSQDVIDEDSGYNTDTVQFLAGVVANDLSYSMDSSDLLIAIKGTGDSLRINGEYTIDRFTFADGTVLSSSDIVKLITIPPTTETMLGTAGNDVLVGSDMPSYMRGLEGDDSLVGNGGDDSLEGDDGNDVLSGGQGRDYLEGGTGSNTYRFDRGTGLDHIESRLADGNPDTVAFGPGITLEDLRVQLGGYTHSTPQPGDSGRTALVVGIGADDAFEISIDLWGQDIARSSVRRFVFADGSELSLAQVLARNDGGVVGFQYGSDWDDNLSGSNADDNIFGSAGNDTIQGRGNDDYICGDSGDDAISGDSGNDMLRGGNGNDVLAGGPGDDILSSDYGNDTYLFNRGDGNDRLEGYASGPHDQDTLSFGAGINPGDVAAWIDDGGELILLVDKGAGGSINCGSWLDPESMEENSTLSIVKVQFIDSDGNVRIFNLKGLVRAKLGSLTSVDESLPANLFDNAERFEITLTTLPAGGDSAVSYAESGDMFAAPLYASASDGTAGDDIVFGTPADDSLNGGAGNDLLWGMGGDDYLQGGPGRDRLEGNDGNDTLAGGANDDALFGEAGDDTLIAGPGNDIAWGGAGNDTYIFNAHDGQLTIEDSNLEEDPDYSGGSGGDGEGEEICFLAEAISSGGDYGGEYDGDYEGLIPAVNVLQFGEGISAEDLRFSEQDGYLVIDIAKTGDQLRLAGYDSTRSTYCQAVDFYRFADGTEINQDNQPAQGLSIRGTMGDDTLLGASGNDLLAGGSGDDTYLFNLGSGADTIDDISVPGMENSVWFGDGIFVDNIHAEVRDGSLVLNVGDGGDAITFAGYDPEIPGMPTPVARFFFHDGPDLSFSELMSGTYEITGTPEQDELFGTPGPDHLRGLAGDDFLAGGVGDDAYLFAEDDGVDTIEDLAVWGAGNTVVLPDGSAPDDVRLSHDPDARTLVVRESATDNEIRLTGFDRLDPLGNRAVQFFQFGSMGTLLSYEELLGRGFDIYGDENNPRLLLGTALTDRIHGGNGDDILVGGTGHDFLFGGGGNDTYIFNLGDGIVSIADTQEPGAGNILRFGPGITPDQVAAHLLFAEPENGNEGTLIIAFGNGDEVRLLGFNPDDVRKSHRSVDTFQFADGTSLSFTDLAVFGFTVTGNERNNELSGTNLSDRFNGRQGNDIMSGGGGRDIYTFSLGDGQDSIIDGSQDGIGNTISFGEGISKNDLIFNRDGNSLVVLYGSQGDRITVLNFAPQGGDGSTVIDTFVFADGTTASYQDFANHAPQAGDAALPDMTIAEGQPFLFHLPDNVFIDVDGDALLYRVMGAGTTNLPAWLQFDPATRAFSGTPGSDDLGSFALTVSATDPQGLTVSRSFAVTVANVNDAPSVAAEEDILLQDVREISGQISATDPDGDILHYSLQREPVNGSLVVDAQGAWQYRPNALFMGIDSAMVSVDDGNGGISSATLQFDVRVSPPDVADQFLTLDEDTRCAGTLQVENPVGGALTYQVTGDAGYGMFSIDENGKWQYAPVANYHGEDAVRVRVTNAYGLCATTTLAMTVASVNDSPAVKVEERYVLLGLPVLAGKVEATDADGDILRYAVAAAPNHGLFTVDGQGGWQYRPAIGYSGEDSAVVSIADGAGGLASTRLSFLVNTYEGGDVSLPKETVDTLNLQGVGKADLSFARDGGALIINIRDKGTIQANGYFTAPGNGLKSLQTEDGPVSLEKEYIVDMGNCLAVLPCKVNGLLGDKLLISGSSRPELFIGGIDNDVIFGSGSNDTLFALPGDDLIVGGRGNDIQFGGTGEDTAYGDQGNDQLFGGRGNDYLVGGDGNDQLSGDSGDDHLAGGEGNDSLSGGCGNDTFVFDTLLTMKKNRDTIVDFASGQDSIELDKRIFSALPGEGTLLSQYFRASASGKAYDDNDYILYNTTTGALSYDSDGNGQGIAVEFAMLVGKPAIKAEDLVIAS